MVNNEDDRSTTELAMAALVAARTAFEKCIEEDGTDPAYFDIRFTAWTLDVNFTQRLERIEIESEVKNDH